MPGMKQSTIKKVLRKKINNWGESLQLNNEFLTNEDVKNIKDNTLICGGAIASMLLGEKPNDYDVYFKDPNITHLVAKYYTKRFNKNHEKGIEVKTYSFKNILDEDENRICFWMQSAGLASETSTEYQYFETVQQDSIVETFFDSLTTADDSIESGLAVSSELRKKGPNYRPIFFTDNAVTLANKVQIIIRFSGPTGEIFKSFDFVHAMCAYDYASDELFIQKESLESLLSKSLIYKGSLYPIASVFRMRKFLERGWRITAGQILKILWQIKDINLEYIPTLRDQLIGVDVAYMVQLIRHLKNVKPGTKIDSIYIAKLIDEIFD